MRLEAERQGFEPRVPFGTTVFKTVAINHSAISPNGQFALTVQIYEDVFQIL